MKLMAMPNLRHPYPAKDGNSVLNGGCNAIWDNGFGRQNPGSTK